MSTASLWISVSAIAVTAVNIVATVLINRSNGRDWLGRPR